MLDRPVAQRVGELHGVADELVALGRQKNDIALGVDLAGLAIPDDLVGGEVIAFAVHPHFAARGHDVGVVVVGDLVGAELDDLVLLRRSWPRPAAEAAGAWATAAAREPPSASAALTTRQISPPTLFRTLE